MSYGFDARAQAIIQIASERRESFFVKSDGSLWRGDIAHQLAKMRAARDRAMRELQQHPGSPEALAKMRAVMDHSSPDNLEPVELIVPNGVTAVAVNGQRNAFFVKKDGSLWAMGENNASYPSDGTSNSTGQPTQIVASGVRAVACGECFTLFLKDDGSVWGFGWSGDGVLGNKNDTVTKPKQIVAGDVVAIAAGYYHSLFIKRDGSLWGLGGNGHGQLGLGTDINQTLSPVEIVASKVVSIAAAHGHSLFIKSDGSLWAMGLNDWGQIGDGTIDWPHRPEQIVSNNVVAITAGYSGSLFLKQDGSLWGMGINWGSDYGEGIEFHSRCPTQIFAAHNSASVANYYYNAQLKTYASIWAGQFNNNPIFTGSAGSKAGYNPSAASLAGDNLITIELLNQGAVRLTYSGEADVIYALERASSLANPNWVSLVTNKAPSSGVLVITNTPDTRMNNFWRIRAVR